MDIVEILSEYKQAFASGLYVSLVITLWVWFIGLSLGAIIGSLAVQYPKTVGFPLRSLGTVITAIPVLIILFWLHYPLQQALSVVIDPLYTAIAALAVVNTFGVGKIVRAGLVDFPRQYVAAARVCGLSRRTTAVKIVLPLLMRQLLPALLLLQVTMFQSSLFASLISVDELFRAAQRVNAEVYRPIEIYTALALFFLLVCLPVNAFAYWLGRRFAVLTSDQ